MLWGTYWHCCCIYYYIQTKNIHNIYLHFTAFQHSIKLCISGSPTGPSQMWLIVSAMKPLIAVTAQCDMNVSFDIPPSSAYDMNVGVTPHAMAAQRLAAFPKRLFSSPAEFCPTLVKQPHVGGGRTFPFPISQTAAILRLRQHSSLHTHTSKHTHTAAMAELTHPTIKDGKTSKS